MCIFWIGEFFSAKLFIASIASTFYKRKLIDEEKPKKVNDSKEFKEDLDRSSMSHVNILPTQSQLSQESIASQFSDI